MQIKAFWRLLLCHDNDSRSQMSHSATTMTTIASLRVPHHDLPAAARLCALSMRDNPIHVRAFGTDQGRRQRHLLRFFSALIPFIVRKGTLTGAYADGALVGVLGMLPPGACRPTGVELLRLLPALRPRGSPIGALRVWHWLGTWARNDPREPHWHLGPLAVAPQQQARGVGSRLMAQSIAAIEASGAIIYLETDKPINVSFYEKFGFSVVATRPVLGVPNWFMRRDQRR